MLLIDNYDSFTYNIAEYLKELGAAPIILKNDEITIDEMRNLKFTSIIISPGPKNPDDAGISTDVIKEFHKSKKILGICLGYQCLAQFFGAKIIKDKNPYHGKVSEINVIKASKLYTDIPLKFNAARYHSLIVEENTLPECLIKNARTKDGLIMGIEHYSLPLYGVQYHPEAILTQYGHQIFKNFIEL